jgi:protein-tyrosine sulfotransferase
MRLVGYRRRWQLWSLLSLTVPRVYSPLIVIGGCHRSGTTLLRVLLGRHPQIAAGPESTVFLKRISSPRAIAGLFGFEPQMIADWQEQSRSQIAFIEKFQSAVIAATGKAVWADKTPGNVTRFAFVRRHFPNARLVHIVRDGRDVVCSFRRQRWPKPCGEQSSLAELRRCGGYWASYVAAGRRFAGDPQYFELRYEDLVRNPETVLRELLRFLNLPWNDDLLVFEGLDRTGTVDREWGPIDDAAVGNWRTQLQPAEKAILCDTIGKTLIALGYESDCVWGGTDTMTARAASSSGFYRRWTRAARIWIELRALSRALTDPHPPWWPRLAAVAVSVIYCCLRRLHLPRTTRLLLRKRYFIAFANRQIAPMALRPTPVSSRTRRATSMAQPWAAALA